MLKFQVICILLVCLTSFSIGVASEEKTASVFSTALPFAELSNAIYEEKSIFSDVSKLQKLTLNEVNNVSGVEVSYALLTNLEEKQHIVVVRGTANVENAIVDMNIRLIDDEQTGIRLHQGFLEASIPIFQKLKNTLNKEYEIITTGHSLGGAVAVILAMQLHSDNFKVSNVVTFGQPKVTNIEGATKFKDLSVVRIVQPKDLVPIVPPMDPLDIQNLDIYWHFGKEYILMENNEYAELEGVSSMLRSVDFITTVPNQENLENHKMTEYLALLKNNSLQAIKVEYKSSFNIKNLFGAN